MYNIRKKLNKLTSDMQSLEYKLECIDSALNDITIVVGSSNCAFESVRSPVKFTEECNQELITVTTQILLKQREIYSKELERISDPLNIAIELSKKEE